VLSLIQRNFTGEGRVRALGAYSAVLATGAAAGHVVGGVLVSADLFGASWPVFLVKVPIGLALLVLGARVLPKDRRDEPELIGVAAFGTLFLNRQTVPGVLESAVALWVCALVLAAASILGAMAGLVSEGMAMATRKRR
jgi:MFS family permease